MALVLLALCPFLILSGASQLFGEQLQRELGGGALGMQLAAGMSDAAYALGAVIAADLIQRVPARQVYLACEVAFVVGSLLAALAPGIVPFAVGHVLQGLATGMLLVAALPPLVTGHGVDKVPLTAAFVSLGLFGAVTLGPVVGGIVGDVAQWRPLFVGTAVIGVLGFVTGLLAFPRRPLGGHEMTFDWAAIPIATVATILSFLGVALLGEVTFASPGFIVPVVLGLAALGALLVTQYRMRHPLMPLRVLTNTLPVTGISLAMVVGAAFITLIELTVAYLLQVAGRSQILSGALLAAQLAGIAVSAWLFKRTLTSRWLPVLPFTGLFTVAAGGAILLGLGAGHDHLVVTTAGVLLGFGAGAGVTPGLFMAALSVPASRLGPTFGLVELLRSEAAFLVGPVLLYLAMTHTDLGDGIRSSVLITVVVTLIGGVVSGVLLLLGGVPPHRPDLETWMGGRTSAYHSPPVAAILRDTSG
ncbi:hypothetical protein Acsp03_02780 [Actinomadura sp. NBRC 104412]|uniref:MFS transporter n=1 Tax=Actinomadura sp. NBRC 104412 TaxID=3032203 RepID=UPI0024A53DE8|nr:MFS transporter [Actinomadura sp. NBRC 104412]GLZ02811.1 hypothetical protein Acsp03_02780 [Actinomadura sp. NBRC 104412]